MNMNKKSILHKTLARALSVKRPHNTPAVSDFTEWLFNALPAELKSFTSVDGAGNLHIDNRIAGSKTLFIAHVDTVHKETGANKIRKTAGMWYADGAPLGADDGAGVAILMHMMHADIKGYYIFSQGEECGGIGAKFLEKSHADLLKQFDRAIAFDRRGTDNIISHQGWGRCASDAFCQALADELNLHDENLMYSPDDTGVYTDTAEFTDIIPECTNISVGYDHEHSQQECLNIHHYELLSQAVLQVQWDKLPVDRDPTVPEYKTSKYDTGLTGWWTKYDSKDYDHTIYIDEFGSANKQIDSKYFGHLHDDDYWETEDLLDAVRDAMEGRCDFLLELISEAVYPEDPLIAVRFLNRRLLTTELLQEAITMAHTYDSSTVLCTLFDAIHCEA
jgi:hypothetical protein